jgi:hypothetical protein
MKKSLYDTEKKFKDTQKAKAGLESDLRGLENEGSREMQENYSMKMKMDKTEHFGKLHEDRGTKEMQLMTNYKNEKEEEMKGLDDNRQKLDAEF